MKKYLLEDFLIIEGLLLETDKGEKVFGAKIIFIDNKDFRNDCRTIGNSFGDVNSKITKVLSKTDSRKLYHEHPFRYEYIIKTKISQKIETITNIIKKYLKSEGKHFYGYSKSYFENGCPIKESLVNSLIKEIDRNITCDFQKINIKEKKGFIKIVFERKRKGKITFNSILFEKETFNHGEFYKKIFYNGKIFYIRLENSSYYKRCIEIYIKEDETSERFRMVMPNEIRGKVYIKE